jgi:hypothetical protein
MTAASEMRRPRDYPKSVYWSMGFTISSYLTFSLVVYRWCKWIEPGTCLPGLPSSEYSFCHDGYQSADVGQ